MIDQIAEQLGGRHGVQLHAEVMDTAYGSAGKRMVELVTTLRPAICVAFGVATKRETISFERFALNIDDSEEVDNAGEQRSGAAIIDGGPLAYHATLPVDALCRHLREADLPAKASNHAGTFVCNHVFYLARHTMETLSLRTLCGFVHVPMPSDDSTQNDAMVRLTIEDLVRSGVWILDYLLERLPSEC